MESDLETIKKKELDARYFPCSLKHLLIFKRWDLLEVNDYFILVNDHDPVPLRYQFERHFGDAFSWEYLQSEEGEFRVKILRLDSTEKLESGRSNGCGGTHSDRSVKRFEVDARGLEPPQPMVVILEAFSELSKGEELSARTDRRPIHLYPELEARGGRFSSVEMSDGSWLTRIERS